MTDLEALPTRRDEAWRWSDLRAALRDRAVTVHPGAHRHIIERLSEGASEVGAQSLVRSEERLYPKEVQATTIGFRVQPGAVVERFIAQGGAGVSLALTRVTVEPGGRYRQFVLAQGGAFCRIETEIEVLGEGAEVELSAVYLVAAGRHADLTSVIRHTGPGGRTAQLTKGAARQGGRGIFQGKIKVERAAQHTDARQHHHALLLAEGAEVNAKPELEIYADDVACAHGNTAGSLDAGALFYLRARGVPETEARALLTEAFLAEAVPDWLSEDQRREAMDAIRAWLAAA